MSNNLSGYELSRTWFDFCFENPELINPNHTAIYLFAVEHCNRLGWKEKFGFPTQMAMDALGIKKHQTYIKYFNDLVEWNFFSLIQKSKNQYSSNIISLSNAMPKNRKALDKAIIIHGAKQVSSNGQSTGQSNGSINKQQTNKQTNQKQTNQERAIDDDFDAFWNLYDKKRNKVKAEKKWISFSAKTKKEIMDYLPKYIVSTPEKKYRKDPMTFFNNESWKDELILDNPEQPAAPIF